MFASIALTFVANVTTVVLIGAIVRAHRRRSRTDDLEGALECATSELDLWVTALNVDPAFAPLRSDPRFTQLTRRLGLIS